jgi:hypothetical protein
MLHIMCQKFEPTDLDRVGARPYRAVQFRREKWARTARRIEWLMDVPGVGSGEPWASSTVFRPRCDIVSPISGICVTSPRASVLLPRS